MEKFEMTEQEFDDEDDDDLCLEDEIDKEWEKRGCSFSEYRDFVRGN